MYKSACFGVKRPQIGPPQIGTNSITGRWVYWYRGCKKGAKKVENPFSQKPINIGVQNGAKKVENPFCAEAFRSRLPPFPPFQGGGFL